MTTAIVVVSYEGAADLPGCLGACRDHAPGRPLIVVDNASRDRSADIAGTEAPQATLIRLTRNAGFTGGNNVGIAAAFAVGADDVLLINQDVRLDPGTVDRLERFLEDHPRAGAVQAGILLPDGRVNSVGNTFNYLGFGYAGGNGLTVEQARQRLPWLEPAAAWEEGAEVPYASGAAVLLRGNALRQVGLFEEELFLYHEDLELCLRLRSQGWSVHVLPAATAVHAYHFSRNSTKWYQLERNRHWVWLAYMKTPTLVMLALPAVVAEVAVCVQAIAGGWLWQKLRAYSYWLDPSRRRYLRSRRRQIQASRRLSDRELLATAGARLEFEEVGGALLDRVANPLSEGLWRLMYPLIRW